MNKMNNKRIEKSKRRAEAIVLSLEGIDEPSKMIKSKAQSCIISQTVWSLQTLYDITIVIRIKPRFLKERLKALYGGKEWRDYKQKPMKTEQILKQCKRSNNKSLQNCCTVCKVHFRLIMNVKSV